MSIYIVTEKPPAYKDDDIGHADDVYNYDSKTLRSKCDVHLDHIFSESAMLDPGYSNNLYKLIDDLLEKKCEIVIYMQYTEEKHKLDVVKKYIHTIKSCKFTQNKYRSGIKKLFNLFGGKFAEFTEFIKLLNYQKSFVIE